MLKENIVDEVIKVIGMYFNNQDWQSYLESLINKDEVKVGIRVILEGINNHK